MSDCRRAAEAKIGRGISPVVSNIQNSAMTFSHLLLLKSPAIPIEIRTGAGGENEQMTRHRSTEVDLGNGKTAYASRCSYAFPFFTAPR